MLIPELIQNIFEGKRDTLAAEFEGWVKESRRFRAFAETYKDKIRKKHRLAGSDEEMLKDLRCELEVAFRLLGDSRFGVEYEIYAARKGRGPDYAVRFRTNTLLNVEVTRMRGEGQNADALTPKLINTVCDKVGQMPPGVVNVLVVMADVGIAEGDMSQAMVALRARAERKDEFFFTRKGFENAVDFLRQFRQMSAILVVGQPNVLWLNPLAKYALPGEIANALKRI